MVHTWKDVGRGKLSRVSNVNITDTYRPLIGSQGKIDGMGPFCDGDDCEPAPSGSYVIHRPPCMTLRSSLTDEERDALDIEECG